jgi:uncharacterized Tic20 family protein
MNISSAREVTSEERLWAAAAHGSAILFMWGLFVPLIVWVTQRQKSAFVAFHALQALAYQLFQMVYWIGLSVAMTVLVVVASLGIVAIAGNAPTDDAAATGMFLIQFLFMGGLFCGIGLYGLIGLLGGGLVLAKRDFGYPLLGGWLKNYLQAQPAAVQPEAA